MEPPYVGCYKSYELFGSIAIKSLLRIDEDAVVDHHSQIVFAIAGEIGDDSFTRFGQIAAATAKSALLKYLPAIGRNQFVIGIEEDEIEIIFGGLKKHEIFAAIAV